jgi:hypothetical protein
MIVRIPIKSATSADIFKVVCLSEDNTIEFIKFVISSYHKPIPIDRIILMRGLVILQDWETIASAGLSEDTVLTLGIKMVAGSM